MEKITPAQQGPATRTTMFQRSDGAGEGNRTLVVSLGSFCSTIELHPQSRRLACKSKGLSPSLPAASSIRRHWHIRGRQVNAFSVICRHCRSPFRHRIRRKLARYYPPHRKTVSAFIPVAIRATLISSGNAVRRTKGAATRVISEALPKHLNGTAIERQLPTGSAAAGMATVPRHAPAHATPNVTSDPTGRSTRSVVTLSLIHI